MRLPRACGCRSPLLRRARPPSDARRRAPASCRPADPRHRASAARRRPPQQAGRVPLHIHVRGGAELARRGHRRSRRAHGPRRAHRRRRARPSPARPSSCRRLDRRVRLAACASGPLRPCDGRPGTPARRAAGPDELVVETDDRGGFCAVGRAPVVDVRAQAPLPRLPLYDAASRDVPVEAAQEHAARAPSSASSRRRRRSTSIASPSPSPRRCASTARDAARPGRPARRRPSARASRSCSRTSAARTSPTRSRAATAARASTSRRPRSPGPARGELVVRFAGNAVLGKAEGSQPVVRRAEARSRSRTQSIAPTRRRACTLDVDVTTAARPRLGRGRRGAAHALLVGRLRAARAWAPATVDDQGHARIVAVFPAGGATAGAARRCATCPPRRGTAPGPSCASRSSSPGRASGGSLARRPSCSRRPRGSRRRLAPRSPRPPHGPRRGGLRPRPLGPRRRPRARLAGGPQRAGEARSPTRTTARRSRARASPSSRPRSRATAWSPAPSPTSAAPSRSRARTAATRACVDSADHSTHEQPLPPPSVLGVALVTRRRALLERLVRWARQKGAPFDGAPEPTPGHVRRVASRASAVEVEAWASRVEQAAYGPERGGRRPRARRAQRRAAPPPLSRSHGSALRRGSEAKPPCDRAEPAMAAGR